MQLLLLLAVLSTSTTAPVIESIFPSKITVHSGEHFLDVRVANFSTSPRTVFVISGPAGAWTLDASSGSDGAWKVWVPVEVVNTIGVYTVIARTGTIQSNPASLEVTGSGAPNLHVPARVIAEATGPSGAIATYEVHATSTTDSNVDVQCAPASGSLFPLGATTVRCTATHDDGGTTSKEFTVTVVDTTPPVLTIPGHITVEAASVNGTIVRFDASAKDAVYGTIPISCHPPSGTLFPVRATAVRCTAVDGSHNSAYGSFTVFVIDAMRPMLTLPPDITVDATSASGAVVTFTATAMDYNERIIPAACTPESGSLFPIGTTLVSCTGTDDRERFSTGTFKVHVIGTAPSPPVLTLPADITKEATSASGAIVTFTATAHDEVDGSIPVTCTPSSGSLFAIGTTVVSCSATNSRGVTASGTFNVTITEPPPPNPPVLTLPADITAEASTPDGAIVHFTATAHDEVDGSIPVTCTPSSGSLFAIGMTVVSCSATNSRGVTATGTFNVQVRDTTPPVIFQITVDPSSLWPVNHRLVEVVVTVTTSDGVDASPFAQIIEVRSSEATTPDDIRITGALTAMLRAERNGQEDPRTYTLVIEVSDASGNTSTGTVDVIVPHDSSGEQTILPKRRRSVRR